MKTDKNKQRGTRTASHDSSIDKLRILATILVLLIHVSAQWTDTLPAILPASGGSAYSAAAGMAGTSAISMAGFTFALACNILSFSSLPLFLMISGALYLAPGKAGSSKSVRHMAGRGACFLLLYAVWKFLYLLESWVLEPTARGDGSFKESVILDWFRLSGKYHLWYLPMLAVLLFLVPLVYEGAQHRKICGWYLILFLATAVLVPTAFDFEFPFKYLLMDFRNLFDLSYFAGYFGYFLLGHFLYEFCCSKASAAESSHRIILPALLWLSAAGSAVISILYAARRSVTDGTTFYGFSSPFALCSCLTAAALFLTFCSGRTIKKKCSGNEPDALSGNAGKMSDMLSQSYEVKTDRLPGNAANNDTGIAPGAISAALSACGLGIYLIHPFILDLLVRAGILSVLKNPFCGIPIVLVLLYLLSLLISFVIGKIPVVRHLIMM